MGDRLVRNRYKPEHPVPWLRNIDGEELDRALVRKLGEEVGEFLSSSSSTEYLGEIVDINQVLLTILARSYGNAVHDYSMIPVLEHKVTEARKEKQQLYGGFDEGLIVIGSELGKAVYSPLGGFLWEAKDE